jgi:DNA-binding HxlR family transcriptional regulator
MHADGLVVRADDRRGAPYRLSAIGEQLAPVHQELADWSLTYLDLLRLQTDGLVTRTGPRFGDPYTLTTAGAALSPVYAAVEHWASPTTALSPAAPTRSTSRRDPDDARATAALGRSPAVYSGLFSHAPQPQPPVPASVTAQAAPARTR